MDLFCIILETAIVIIVILVFSDNQKLIFSEVVGNLESTGMVPRLKSNSPRR